MQISKEDLIKVATAEAKRLGFKTEEMIALNPDVLTEWEAYYRKAFSRNEKLPKTYVTDWRKQFLTLPTLSEKLEKKDVVAIYFGPKKMQLGGDLWVLIDNKTGEVIFALPGK